MSYILEETVRKYSKCKGSAFHVLCYLAFRANGNATCWPSQETIAADTRLSVRSVGRAIQDAVDAGELIVAEQGNGRGHSALYQIVITWPEEDIPPKGRHSDHLTENEPPKKVVTVSKKVDIDDTKVDMVSVKVDTVTTQYKELKEEHKEHNFINDETDPIHELLGFFCEVTFLDPPDDYRLGGKREKWLDPFVSIYKATGNDFERTKRCIEEGVQIIKANSKYTLASPKSILTSALGVANKIEQEQMNQLFKGKPDNPWANIDVDEANRKLAAGAAGI